MIVENHPIFNHPIVRSLLTAFEFSQFSFVITTAKLDVGGYHFLYVNQKFKEQTGYIESELLGQSPKILQGAKTDPKVLADLKTTTSDDQVFLGQAINYRKDGSEYLVRWSINPLKDEQSNTVGYLSCQLEVTEFVKNEEQAFFLAEALNQAAEAALITDLFGNIIYANNALSQLTGYATKEMLGRSTRMFKSEKMPRDFYKNMWNMLLKNEPFEGVFINRHKNGRHYYEQKVITPIFDKNHQPIYYLALSKDTSSVIQKTLSLELKAYHDALTGLFNREKFNEVLDYKIRFFNKVGPIFSMIVADIDNFKQINDVHGHAVGDEVLKSVATLFLGNLRNDDMVFRWGGEEFCFLIAADAERAAHVADLLRIKVANQAFANLNVGAVTISFGVTAIKAHESAEPLFVRADEALYAAKHSGKNTVVLR